MQQASTKSLQLAVLNPLARMLPLFRPQVQTYHLADKNPPGLEGYQPRWEVVNAVLGSLATLQMKVDIMTDFNLLAILASATTNTVGGFRAQYYDAIKQRKLQDRGLQFTQLGGGARAPFFLREPYAFDQPRPQMLVQLTNLESATNTVQIVFYGLAAPFQGTLSNEY